MDEIIFVVEEAAEGGYSARALGASIFTDADDLEALQAEVRDAVLCHFEDAADRPRVDPAPPSAGSADRRMSLPRHLSGNESDRERHITIPRRALLTVGTVAAMEARGA